MMDDANYKIGQEIYISKFQDFVLCKIIEIKGSRMGFRKTYIVEETERNGYGSHYLHDKTETELYTISNVRKIRLKDII